MKRVFPFVEFIRAAKNPWLTYGMASLRIPVCACMRACMRACVERVASNNTNVTYPTARMDHSIPCSLSEYLD